MIDDEIAGIRVTVRAIPRSVDLSIPDTTKNGRTLIDANEIDALIRLLFRARAELEVEGDPGVFDFVTTIDRGKNPAVVTITCRLCGLCDQWPLPPGAIGLYVCRCGARCPTDEGGLKP